MEPNRIMRREHESDGLTLTVKSIMDKFALEVVANEDAMIRAELVKLGWTPPESRAIAQAERAVCETSLAVEAVGDPMLELGDKDSLLNIWLAAVRALRQARGQG